MFSNLYPYSVKFIMSKVMSCCCMLLFSLTASSSVLPASIDKVQTYRVNDFLVRFVMHNMEVNPIVEIDKISTPEYMVIDSLKIKSVIVGNEKLIFNESSGVFVESFSSKNNDIFFSLEYFYLEGGSNYIDCVISFDEGLISAPKCGYKD